MTCEHVELAVIPDTGDLHLVYGIGYFHQYEPNGSDTRKYMYEVTSPNGVDWTAPAFLAKKTEQPISIITCDGITHMTHGGFSNPEEIWWSERTGGAWGLDYKVSGQVSWGGAALGCFSGTRTLMVHNGGTNQLWQSEFGL